MTTATTAAGDGSGVRRFVPPPRAAVDPQVFAHPVFAGLRDVRDLLEGPEWPSIAALAARLTLPGKHLVEQDAALLADGLHYEARIAQGLIATRADNWHDLFNALVWCGPVTRSSSRPSMCSSAGISRRCRRASATVRRPR